MLINEHKMTRDNGEEFLLVVFYHHKAEIFRSEIPLKYDRCPALKISRAKETAIEEFLASFHGKKYTRKEVLKAWSKVDPYFKDVFKQEFPRGGWRGGGRPKGTTTSDRTERFTQAISKEEKEFLTRALEDFRKNKQAKTIDDENDIDKKAETYIKTHNKHKVSDEYIQAVKEIQQEQPRRRLLTLDEAYKAYREGHSKEGKDV